LDLRTKQCCHEHASEIFTIYPATCEPLGIFATGNEYNNLKVHFRVKDGKERDGFIIMLLVHHHGAYVFYGKIDP
ncbi:MAG TPA: hypothetical protein VJZ49_00400, partial [Syntrophales bacterium]|nr:hypothetical protein [Syntrophales bacterium]